MFEYKKQKTETEIGNKCVCITKCGLGEHCVSDDITLAIQESDFVDKCPFGIPKTVWVNTAESEYKVSSSTEDSLSIFELIFTMNNGAEIKVDISSNNESVLTIIKEWKHTKLNKLRSVLSLETVEKQDIYLMLNKVTMIKVRELY